MGMRSHAIHFERKKQSGSNPGTAVRENSSIVRMGSIRPSSRTFTV